VLDKNELITGATVPPLDRRKTAYMKVTSRSADDWPALGVAVSVKVENKAVAAARITVAAATEKLTRLGSAEAALAKQEPSEAAFERTAEAATEEAETIDDSRGSAAYKTALLRVYVRRALRQALRNGGAQ